MCVQCSFPESETTLIPMCHFFELLIRELCMIVTCTTVEHPLGNMQRFMATKLTRLF
jgi:hypothetical protein